MKLTRMIARDVWVSCDQLLKTRTALIGRAEELDSAALALTSRAAEISAEQAAGAPKKTRDRLA